MWKWLGTSSGRKSQRATRAASPSSDGSSTTTDTVPGAVDQPAGGVARLERHHHALVAWRPSRSMPPVSRLLITSCVGGPSTTASSVLPGVVSTPGFSAGSGSVDRRSFDLGQLDRWNFNPGQFELRLRLAIAAGSSARNWHRSARDTAAGTAVAGQFALEGLVLADRRLAAACKRRRASLRARRSCLPGCADRAPAAPLLDWCDNPGGQRAGARPRRFATFSCQPHATENRCPTQTSRFLGTSTTSSAQRARFARGLATVSCRPSRTALQGNEAIQRFARPGA